MKEFPTILAIIAATVVLIVLIVATSDVEIAEQKTATELHRLLAECGRSK